MNTDIDFEILKRIIDGEHTAFEELFEKYKHDIYWQARKMLGNHLDADEITQEVFLTIYKKAKDFKYQSTLKTWIYRITFNKSVNLINKNKIRRVFNLDNVDSKELQSNHDILKNIEDKEKIEKLDKVLQGLPVKQREVFILRHEQGLAYNEIAQITGKSIGSIKANYFHAFKKVLGKMGNEKE